MADSTITAIEYLKQELERLEQEQAVRRREGEAQVAILKKALANFTSQHGSPTNGSAPTHTVSQPSPTGGRSYTITSFQGMTNAAAFDIYMRARENSGKKISFGKIVQDLLEGGLQLLEDIRPEFRERAVMAIARQTPRLYGYDRKGHSTWLAPTADTSPLPEARSRNNKESRSKN
jgi:hypothetical protein